MHKIKLPFFIFVFVLGTTVSGCSLFGGSANKQESSGTTSDVTQGQRVLGEDGVGVDDVEVIQDENGDGAVQEGDTMEQEDVADEVKEDDVEDKSETQKSFTVTAKQWEFEPSTITVNKGDTVRITVISSDVAHGIAIPAFNVSKRLEPGETATVEFVADKEGSFNFFCNVQCGSGHKDMTGMLIVR